MSDGGDPEVAGTEVTRKFPPGKPKGLDPEILRPLLRDAARAYLEIISKTEVRTYRREIFRLKEDSIYREDVLFHWYLWNHEIIEPELKSLGFRPLLDFFWEQGEPSYSSRGSNPQRHNWELYVLHEIVDSLVTRSLIETAFNEASDTGVVTPWHLDDSALEGEIERSLLRWSDGRHRYLARCPIGYLDMEVGAEWLLAEGIKVKRYTPREVTRWNTLNNPKMNLRDVLPFSFFNDMTIVEITGFYEPNPTQSSRPRTIDEIVKEEVANKVDMTKWALMEVVGGGMPLIEGPVTYELDSDKSSHITGRWFRREDKSGGAVYKLEAAQIQKASDLLVKALRLRPTSTDLEQAFFHWGRSALAELERDQLLDAVIGLEALLVTEPGETSYRFRLHGTALLAKNAASAEKHYRELKDVYDARSSVAHGNKSKKQKHASAPINARRFLGNAIKAIMELGEAGSLNLTSGVAVAKQIEAAIIKTVSIKADSSSS